MWSEWLARTLSLGRRADAPPAHRDDVRLAAPPDLEADGLHPGADEFRAALAKTTEEASSS